MTSRDKLSVISQNTVLNYKGMLQQMVSQLNVTMYSPIALFDSKKVIYPWFCIETTEKEILFLTFIIKYLNLEVA